MNFIENIQLLKMSVLLDNVKTISNCIFKEVNSERLCNKSHKSVEKAVIRIFHVIPEGTSQNTKKGRIDQDIKTL